LETEKSIAITTNGKSPTGNGVTTVDMRDGVHYRKLTPLECERLQTLPDNATLIMEMKTTGKYKGQVRQAVSDTQRYKMIGNGFNIETVAHILSQLYTV
jgi:DNA (cytosine-5)-methyltransferase 3A